jgi:hypothetical protein
MDRDAEDLLKGVALVVVGSCEGRSVVETVGLGSADVVRGELQAFHVHGVLLGPFPDLLRRDLHPIGQEITQALALAHHVEQFGHRDMVSEAQVHASRVFQRQDPPLEELHRKGDRDPR